MIGSESDNPMSLELAMFSRPGEIELEQCHPVFDPQRCGAHGARCAWGRQEVEVPGAALCLQHSAQRCDRVVPLGPRSFSED